MKEVKLTEAQQEVMDRLHRNHDAVIACDSFEDYAVNVYHGGDFDSFEAVLKWEYRLGKKRGDKAIERMRRYYEMEKQGIFLAHASSHTLRALERRGLIEIIRDSAGASYYGIDIVKLLDI